jgi:hypothetical protein
VTGHDPTMQRAHAIVEQRLRDEDPAARRPDGGPNGP